MAEETQAAAAAEVVVITTTSATATSVKETEVPLPSAPEPEEELKKDEDPKGEPAAVEKEEEAVKEKELPQSTSFKEESNKVADLVDPEKKALDDLKLLVQAALANNEFSKPPPPPPKEEEKPKEVEAVKPKEDESAKVEEEPKKEEEPAKGEEETKKGEETTIVEVVKEVEEVKIEEAPKEVDQPTKPEASKEAEQLTTPPPAKEEPTEAAKPEKEKKDVAAVDDDGAKTVEAIEETVVPVAAPAAVEPEKTEKDVAVEAAPPPASAEPEEITLWGVRLLDGSEKSDTILLKFLRARDFKPKDALAMLRKTVLWRKDFGTDGLLEEDLGVPELERVVFMHGVDREGHPVCYNAYGEFQDKELYQKAFGDEEKRKRFLRWRVQFLEKGIKERLDFGPEGVNTMVQITDLKNSPGPGRLELGKAIRQGVTLLQDNYPEFVAKQVFINVPWWYLAFHRMISPFLTQRTKSKFVYAGPSRSADTLFKYIAPEQVPVQYGGLSSDNNTDFTISDAVTEVTIKPSSKHTIEIHVTEPSLLVWELRVLGWDVSYGAEFVPDAEGGYTVIVQKSRKFVATDEPIVKNSFKIGEPGKIVLTVDNATSRKKKLLYRSKTKSSTD